MIVNSSFRRTAAGISTLAVSVLLLTASVWGEKGGFPIDVSGSCVSESCHADLGTKKYVHEPAADESGCTDCHEMKKEGVHSFRLIAEGGALCAECHEGKADGKFVHTPVADGECTECHDSHQSDNPKQLVHPPGSSLCFSCHDQEDFAGAYTHEPVREGECLECHNPHRADNPNQLVAAVPSLCTGCHGIEMVDQKGTFLTSEKRLFQGGEAVLHPPFEEGACFSCHLPHASRFHRLLKKNYPTMLYAKFSDDTYALCLGCHEEMAGVLKVPRTLTRTQFRNGNLNLHYRHVNKEKGRSCKVCHHHHGTKEQKLIRRTFYFGTMDLVVDFEKTGTGGSCAPSCHVRARYDRYDPAENPMNTTPREGEDATPEELERSRQLDNLGRREAGQGAGDSPGR